MLQEVNERRQVGNRYSYDGIGGFLANRNPHKRLQSYRIESVSQPFPSPKISNLPDGPQQKPFLKKHCDRADTVCRPKPCLLVDSGRPGQRCEAAVG